MVLAFLPKSSNFFDLFDKQVDYVMAASALFKDITSTGAANEEAVQKMHEIERQADEVAHAILDQLNKTFITPFDREDIHALAKELDDVTDMIYTIVNRLVVYKLAGVDKNLAEFGRVIDDSTRSVSCAVRGLRNLKNRKSISEACVEVNRLENVGDAMRNSVLLELFEAQKDPIAVIKWKEIYEDSETVLDICEDVVHVVQSILVKQA